MPNEDLLKKPLYVYDLPTDILESLVPRSDISTLSAAIPEPSVSSTPEPSSTTSSTDCALCGIASRNVDEQRAHFRSDLHKLNVKRRIRGQPALTESQFEKLLEGDGEVESISGSEDTDSSTSSADERKRSKGANPSSKKNALEEDEDDDRPQKGANKEPVLWFTSPRLPEHTSLGVYRALFPTNTSDLVSFLQQNQLPSPPPNQKPPSSTIEEPAQVKAPHFFLCMLGGGHFAAMVVSLAPSMKSGDREATVLAHRTFHRYTTRRKQGGAQSSNDNAKGNAHSAGAALRRYNEAELTKDIRELLMDWKHWIDSAELLFVRAAGTANRRVLYFYDDAILRLKDERLRGFPFTTRRATQSELMRSFVELTRVKVSRVDLAALAAQTAALGLTDKPATPTPKKPEKPKLSAEEKLALEHTTTLTSLIKRSKIPAVVSYFSANDLPPTFTFAPQGQHHHASTPLHLASSLSNHALVLALLTKGSVDPTAVNGDGKTASEIAGDRTTRDAFRVARHILGDKFDWDAAHVGLPLAQKDFEQKLKEDEKSRSAADATEKARRAQEAERIRKEEAAKQEKGRTGGLGLGGGGAGNNKTLGGGVGVNIDRERDMAGMTPEMRARLERERRARAAEARMGKR